MESSEFIDSMFSKHIGELNIWVVPSGYSIFRIWREDNNKYKKSRIFGKQNHLKIAYFLQGNISFFVTNEV